MAKLTQNPSLHKFYKTNFVCPFLTYMPATILKKVGNDRYKKTSQRKKVIMIQAMTFFILASVVYEAMDKQQM